MRKYAIISFIVALILAFVAYLFVRDTQNHR